MFNHLKVYWIYVGCIIWQTQKFIWYHTQYKQIQFRSFRCFKVFRNTLMMTSSNGNISALLAICVENSPVAGEFPTQRPVPRNFDDLYICVWKNGWENNREGGDLRRHCAHYDVTVMCRCIGLTWSDDISFWVLYVILKWNIFKIFKLNSQSVCHWTQRHHHCCDNVLTKLYWTMSDWRF